MKLYADQKLMKVADKIALGQTEPTQTAYLSNMRKKSKPLMDEWHLQSKIVAGNKLYFLIQAEIGFVLVFDEQNMQIRKLLSNVLHELQVFGAQRNLYYESMFAGNNVTPKLEQDFVFELDLHELETQRFKEALKLPNHFQALVEYSAVLTYANQPHAVGGGFDYFCEQAYRLEMKANTQKKVPAYVDLKADFADYQQWNEFYLLGKEDPNFRKIRKQILANNYRLLDQLSKILKQKRKLSDKSANYEVKIVAKFINDYLLATKIETPSSNLFEIGDYLMQYYYTAMTSQKDFQQIAQEKNEIAQALDDLYHFMSRTGMIKKSDYDKVVSCLKEALLWTKEKDDGTATDFSTPTLADFMAIYTNLPHDLQKQFLNDFNMDSLDDVYQVFGEEAK